MQEAGKGGAPKTWMLNHLKPRDQQQQQQQQQEEEKQEKQKDNDPVNSSWFLEFQNPITKDPLLVKGPPPLEQHPL